MALFVKEETKIYYVHIPRCGGRYVKNIFEENEYNTLHNDWEQSIIGISVMHLHYPYYNYLEGVQESPKFSVVRDPFNRFCSSAFLTAMHLEENPEECFNSLTDKSFLEDFIFYHSITDRYNSNWFRKQAEFLSDDVLFYKLEDGMNIPFIKWCNKSFSTNLVTNPNGFSYSGGELEQIENPLKQNKKLEEHIKDLYKEDYELLGY